MQNHPRHRSCRLHRSNFVRNSSHPAHRARLIAFKLTVRRQISAIWSDLPKRTPTTHFRQQDICDEELVAATWSILRNRSRPFAAESHVDRSVSLLRPFHSCQRRRHAGCCSMLLVQEVEKFLYSPPTKSTHPPLRQPEINSPKRLAAPNSPYIASKLPSPPPGGPHPPQPTRPPPHCGAPTAPNGPRTAARAIVSSRSYFQPFTAPSFTSAAPHNYGPYHFAQKLIPLFVHQPDEAKKSRSTATAELRDCSTSKTTATPSGRC